MASLFQRPRSRFWWVKYRNPATGKIVRESTGIDATLPGSKARAKARASELTRRELLAPKTNPGERFESWASDYLERRYAKTGSLRNARLALHDLLAFVRERELVSPRQISYAIASEFVPWLEKRGLSRNTARLRSIYFSILLSEAVRRGIAEANPFREVRNRKAATKQKKEISETDQLIIEAALVEKKEWMREQWLVLMRQGCRISETYVTLDRIDEKQETIIFRVKGGRMHTAQLHPDLLPLITKARTEGRKTLIEAPPSAGPIWSDFFAKLGLPYSIHCTRVTAITRMLRDGHSAAQVASFIGHSELINRVYRRLQPSDARALLKSLGAVSSPSRDSDPQ
jgi:hypothetical protein